MGPVAFGQIQRGFSAKTQAVSGTSALVPVGSYVIPEGMVSSLRPAMLLFRDQGVPLDTAEVERIFGRLGVPLQWKELQLLPTMQRWRTADRTFDILLDIEKRSLNVTRLGSFGPSPEGAADNETVIAIARIFAVSLGIDTVPYGEPRIVERPAEAGGPLKTYVTWPMMVQGVPLLDADAQPVLAVQIQVGRLSRMALGMTMTLLQPDLLAKSAYPTPSPEVVTMSLKSGGLLPVAGGLKGTKTDVRYTSLTPSYVLLPSDKEYPTYIVPILLAEFLQGPRKGRTFIPALSPDQFLWRPPAKQITLPAGSGSLKLPTSASGAVKTGAGS